MSKKKVIFRKPPRSNASNNEVARVWVAAGHVLQMAKLGTLTPAMHVVAAPFVTAAVELALATVTADAADIAAVLKRVSLALETSMPELPSLTRRLTATTAKTAAAANHWRQVLVRHAVAITRKFSGEAVMPSPGALGKGSEEPYATTPAALLEDAEPSRLWLIEHLWQRSGTGIIGGPPKSAKTWLALDIALSVASATPALDTFDVHCPGGVVYVSAEGGEGYLKQRLNALCTQRDLSLGSLPHRLDIIPRAIRIDTCEGYGRLRATIEMLRPTLLILDPLVRLHRLDENSASSVSGLLSSLTELQQAFDMAVILVHHATKQGAKSRDMGGQDFRGSSDFHAWGSSNIFARKRRNDHFVISAEHRAAPATQKWTLKATADDNPRLEIIETEGSADAEDEGISRADQRMEGEIERLVSVQRHSVREIRAKVKGGNERIGAAIRRLEAQQRITRDGSRWAATNGSASRE
jgi:hypothetical protein